MPAGPDFARTAPGKSPKLCNSASGPGMCLPGRILQGLLPGNHRNSAIVLPCRQSALRVGFCNDCSREITYIVQWCFRAGNRTSGPDFARTAFGKSPKSCNSASGPEIGLPGRILQGLLPGNHRNSAIVLPGRKSAFRAGLCKDCSREIAEIVQ